MLGALSECGILNLYPYDRASYHVCEKARSCEAAEGRDRVFYVKMFRWWPRGVKVLAEPPVSGRYALTCRNRDPC